MKMRALYPVSLVVMLSIVGVAAADELEGVEKKISESWDKLKSMSADMTLTSEMSGTGFSMKSNAKGTLETVKKSDKWLMRMEQKSSNVQKMGDQETKIEDESTMISDGDYIYTVSNQGGQKTAMKMKADAMNESAGGKKLFEQLKKDNALKLLPDEKVDGKDAYVIEATPKAAEGGATPVTYYFSKDAGIAIKVITKGPDGKPMQTMTLTNVKIDPDLKPDRFVFKAPEGVEVMDMSKQMAPAETAAPAKPETPAAPTKP